MRKVIIVYLHVMANLLMQERGWSIAQETHVLSGFYMGYLVTMFFGGFISQRIGAKVGSFM